MKANPSNTGNNGFPSYHTIVCGPGWEMFLSPGRQFIEKAVIKGKRTPCSRFSLKRTGVPEMKHKVFARLLQKAAGWRGGALPRPSQWAKRSDIPKAQEGKPNPSKGFPIVHSACVIGQGNFQLSDQKKTGIHCNL